MKTRVEKKAKAGFFFRGMSTYHGSASVPVSSSGTTGTQSAGLGGTVSGGAVNPTLPLEPVGTMDEPFSLKISDSYTFTDPEGLDFDARYVLYGGSNSSAVTIVNQQGCHVAEMYEILYVKDGRAVAEYRCYRGADEASAQLAAALKDIPVETIIISVLAPYPAMELKEWADKILMIYSYSPYSFNAVFGALHGEFVPRGTFPLIE